VTSCANSPVKEVVVRLAQLARVDIVLEHYQRYFHAGGERRDRVDRGGERLEHWGMWQHKEGHKKSVDRVRVGSSDISKSMMSMLRNGA
jgi:hypothetical protein